MALYLRNGNTKRCILSNQRSQGDVYRSAIPLPAPTPPPIPPRNNIPNEVRQIHIVQNVLDEVTLDITWQEDPDEKCNLTGSNGYHETWNYQSEIIIEPETSSLHKLDATPVSTRSIGTQTNTVETRDVGTQTDFEMTFPWCGSTWRRPSRPVRWSSENTYENIEEKQDKVSLTPPVTPSITPAPSRVNTETRPVTGICWQCGRRGHCFSKCPEERRGKFCYRCGTPGVTMRLCPTCSSDWERTRLPLKDLKIQD